MSAPWRVLLSSWPWRALGYLLISAVLALLLVPIGVLTILLLPLWGILCGMLERRRQRMLGFPAQPSGHVRVGREQRHNWLNIRLTEPATWREVVVLLVDLVAGAIAVGLDVLVAQAMMITVLVVIAVRDPALGGGPSRPAVRRGPHHAGRPRTGGGPCRRSSRDSSSWRSSAPI